MMLVVLVGDGPSSTLVTEQNFHGISPFRFESPIFFMTGLCYLTVLSKARQGKPLTPLNTNRNIFPQFMEPHIAC